MRVTAIIISAFAIAAIVGSATAVITRDPEPRLSVQVTGVPGYIYYERSYDLKIEYANQGGAIHGPIELTAELPETFALAEHIADPTRHGERLVWTLNGLGAGESGAVTITVQGTLPEDLTNAVYDLPGYEGHTAFVEGFDLPISLTAGETTVGTLAVADTGEVSSGSLTIIKDVLGGEHPQDFDFTVTDIPGCGPATLDDDGNNASAPTNELLCQNFNWSLYVDGESETVEITETLPEGWEAWDIDCQGAIDFETSTDPFRVTITDVDPDADVTCVFYNDPPDLIIVKVCEPGNPEPNPAFLVEVLEGGEFAAGGNAQCGDTLYAQLPQGTYEVEESEIPDGWVDPPSYSGDCTNVVVAEQEPDVVLELPAAASNPGIANAFTIPVCTVTNFLEGESLFQKYTDPEDEVLSPGETFTWYIEVPAQEGHWFLVDWLPNGTWLNGQVVEPIAGVICQEFATLGVTCQGHSTESMVLELPVKAPHYCGEFTNLAKLTNLDGPHAVWHTVAVEGCETPVLDWFWRWFVRR